jgi:V-type H+-transporting ATPase S1 subunit
LESAGNSIGVKLLLSGGTWYAYRLTLNGAPYLSIDPISAYFNKSFGCGNITMSNGKKNVFLEHLQIQPRFLPNGEENVTKFSDGHNDCVGFFSPAIWGALFVIILFVFILSIGLTMMMDIKTMDRFDDPKGKTITINAQE